MRRPSVQAKPLLHPIQSRDFAGAVGISGQHVGAEPEVAARGPVAAGEGVAAVDPLPVQRQSAVVHHAVRARAQREHDLVDADGPVERPGGGVGGVVVVEAADGEVAGAGAAGGQVPAEHQHVPVEAEADLVKVPPRPRRRR